MSIVTLRHNETGQLVIGVDREAFLFDAVDPHIWQEVTAESSSCFTADVPRGMQSSQDAMEELAEIAQTNGFYNLAIPPNAVIRNGPIAEVEALNNEPLIESSVQMGSVIGGVVNDPHASISATNLIESINTEHR